MNLLSVTPEINPQRQAGAGVFMQVLPLSS